MPREAADDNTAVSEPRCETENTLLDEECERPGEVRYRGMLLCAPHAALLGLEDRAEALLGSVFRMDEWMEENGSSSSDEEFVGRLRHEREEIVAALRLTRAQLRTARKALSVGG
jgi:glycine/D-amino acid oxidase-like deaminating enzyme